MKTREIEIMPADEMTRTRLVVYDFLRRMFLHEPTEEILNRLLESGLLNELDGLPGVNEMRTFLEKTLSCDDLGLMRQDFFQLFLGPGRLKAPPWESVYISVSRLVNRKATTDVRRFYAEHGFITEEGQLEDHFGTECDFLFRLIRRSEDAGAGMGAGLLKSQECFFSMHLLPWVPQFADDIMRGARTPFYKGLGEFIRYWVEVEQEYFAW